MKQEINITDKGIHLLTTTEACDILKVKHNTFYRHYRHVLTPYRNAEKADRRLYWNKQEVEQLYKDKRQKPTKVYIDA